VVRDLQLGVIVLDDEDRCVLVNQWVSARAPELGALRPGAIVEAIAGVPCQRLLDEDVTHVTTASERLLAITASPSTNNRETVIVINDLTEERERQNQAAHRDRVALIGQLAGGVAHDFNNLLQVILTYSDMLEESATDPGTREDVQQITHAARSASDLTRQLLTFSRRELVEPTVVDVAHVVQGMEKLLHRMLGPQIQLAVSIAQRIPRILIDAAQLEQVLMNLVVNARDALAGKGRIEIAVRGNGRNVEIEVADDGPGIAPQTLARIFEPYFTTKPRGKGTGLGLATVHGIVLQARGDIAVESALGTGTRFRIVLPATDRVEERAAPVTASPVCEGTLLVVDDDDNVRRVTERLLRHAGYTILAASSGPEALAIARKHPEIDLLLTDIVMPGMSGRDLAQEISVLRPAMHVIFMSGYHQHAPISNTQFLAKPFTRTELLDRVQAVLANEVAACERGATLAPR
jgi:two-component system cell cycle sensor histidine kinase/response regulator CckA